MASSVQLDYAVIFFPMLECNWHVWKTFSLCFFVFTRILCEWHYLYDDFDEVSKRKTLWRHVDVVKTIWALRLFMFVTWYFVLIYSYAPKRQIYMDFRFFCIEETHSLYITLHSLVHIWIQCLLLLRYKENSKQRNVKM